MTPARDRVAQALAALPHRVAPRGAGCWEVALPVEQTICARVAGGGRWLALVAVPRAAAAAAAPARSGSLAALLERGSALRGLAKIALVPGDDVPQLRAELPLDADGSLSPRLLAAVTGILRASATERTAGILDLEDLEDLGDLEDERAPSEDLPATGLDAVAARCRMAGWVVLAQRPDFLALDLGLDDVAARARVAPDREGHGLRAWAELDRHASPLDVCRDAAARFLLEAAATVCMVRPFATPAGESGAVVVGFEARLAAPFCARELEHALAALAVATRTCGREVAVLARDADVAAHYLALREATRTRHRAPRDTRTPDGAHGGEA